MLLPPLGCRAAALPNILFLLSDDHSYPYLGCYGNKDVHTPQLDRFASQGMRFDRMFGGCPQCVPSRATLMTGRSAVAVRMVRFTSPLPAELPALPGVRSDLARYIAEVEHLDGDVQSVLDTLMARGLVTNTLVVFMGDNGMALPHGKGAVDLVHRP
jgi:N-sulfoglucosamine sulfohydrolase